MPLFQPAEVVSDDQRRAISLVHGPIRVLVRGEDLLTHRGVAGLRRARRPALRLVEVVVHRQDATPGVGHAQLLHRDVPQAVLVLGRPAQFAVTAGVIAETVVGERREQRRPVALQARRSAADDRLRPEGQGFRVGGVGVRPPVGQERVELPQFARPVGGGPPLDALGAAEMAVVVRADLMPGQVGLTDLLHSRTHIGRGAEVDLGVAGRVPRRLVQRALALRHQIGPGEEERQVRLRAPRRCRATTSRPSRSPPPSKDVTMNCGGSSPGWRRSAAAPAVRVGAPVGVGAALGVAVGVAVAVTLAPADADRAVAAVAPDPASAGVRAATSAPATRTPPPVTAAIRHRRLVTRHTVDPRPAAGRGNGTTNAYPRPYGRAGARRPTGPGRILPMAQKTVVLLEDDLDGGVATETVTFSLDGVSYEMDLSEKNATGTARGCSGRTWRPVGGWAVVATSSGRRAHAVGRAHEGRPHAAGRDPRVGPWARPRDQRSRAHPRADHRAVQRRGDGEGRPAGGGPEPVAQTARGRQGGEGRRRPAVLGARRRRVLPTFREPPRQVPADLAHRLRARGLPDCLGKLTYRNRS